MGTVLLIYNIIRNNKDSTAEPPFCCSKKIGFRQKDEVVNNPVPASWKDEVVNNPVPASP